MSIGVPGAVISAGTSILPTRPADLVPPFPSILVTTPPPGYVLINGTGPVFSVQAPSDSKQHGFNCTGGIVVGTTEVGGQLQISYTLAGVVRTAVASAGSLATGVYSAGTTAICDAGSIITLSQSTALTTGAATFYGCILITY